MCNVLQKYFAIALSLVNANHGRARYARVVLEHEFSISQQPNEDEFGEIISVLAGLKQDGCRHARICNWLPSQPRSWRAWFFAELMVRLKLPGPHVEIGVQRGVFSRVFLRNLLRLRNETQGLPKLFLIDTWRRMRQDERYNDMANVANFAHQKNLKAVVDSLSMFWDNVSLLQLSSRQAAPLFNADSLGFVYLDARHDYCAVRDDIFLYWPKLVHGGILAGDDWGQVRGPCENGTWVSGGLSQAVEEFAGNIEVPIFVFKDQWILQKTICI